MSKVFKSLKKVARVALPMAAAFIPGIGPLASAALGAAGGALGGGGLKGAILGGLGGALGGGAFGSTGSLFGGATEGLGGLANSLNSGLLSLTSPLRSLVGGFASPDGGGILQSLFGGGSESPMTAGAASAYSPAEQNFLSMAQGASGGSGGGPLSIIDRIKNFNMNDAASMIQLANTLGAKPAKGLRSQEDIMNEMYADKQRQQEQNKRFMDSLNSAPLERKQTNPDIDYYSYGSRPETLFYDNVAGNPRAFAKGGLNSIGGQDDTISAKLSAGEYVIPADVVSSLGDGNTDAGAKHLDSMLKNVRKHKSSAMKKGVLPPKAKSPLAYLGARA